MLDIVHITTGLIFSVVVFNILYIVKNENNGEWDDYDDTGNIILDILNILNILNIFILVMSIKFILSFTYILKEVNEAIGALTEETDVQNESIKNMTR